MLANNGAPMLPTVILTRPQAQSESFAAEIAASWTGELKIIQSPLLEIVHLPIDAGHPDAVIFSSANGVLAARSADLPSGLPAWCVGSKTAKIAQDAGFDAIAGPGDAERLVADIVAAKPLGKLAHIRGKHARGHISQKLNAAGLRCQDVVAYDQREIDLTEETKVALCADSLVIFPLFSPRTASILNQHGPFACPTEVVALSSAVKEAVGLEGVVHMTVATEPTAEAMLCAVLAAIQRVSDRR